ncbi:MAG: 4-hydroxy-tetrahydrodipicolinate synthase [Pelagibacterales bacterium]|jgi:4-hydroxy-tetrahydrodipicolinate synthase|nr:4-hydroxy-tetrahydrodipicolinate synthase [Pelagibacterales bacterium]
MLKGSIVALLTPFKDNILEEDVYSDLINYHLENGTNGIVPGGTTGESPTLSHNEHKRIIEIAVRECKGKIPVIAGTGSNSTHEAVELSKFAEKAGSNALLVVTPYYNKPTQEGLYQHYKKINDNVGVPIVIYNIPSRSVIDMSVETMTKLYELKNIIGVKDATGDLNRVDRQLKSMGKDFIQLTGNDDNALEFNKRGGVGSISVTANIAAKLCSQFQDSCVSNLNQAEELDKVLQPVHSCMFIESNPSPVKYAASLLGMCNPDVRLPLVEVREESKKKISESLKVAKIL